MANNLDRESLQKLISTVKEKWIREEYSGGTTASENIRTWMIADLLMAVLDHIGIAKPETVSEVRDMNDRRMDQLVDSVCLHWNGETFVTKDIFNRAISEVLDDCRRQNKINDES